MSNNDYESKLDSPNESEYESDSLDDLCDKSHTDLKVYNSSKLRIRGNHHEMTQKEQLQKSSNSNNYSTNLLYKSKPVIKPFKHYHSRKHKSIDSNAIRTYNNEAMINIKASK